MSAPTTGNGGGAAAVAGAGPPLELGAAARPIENVSFALDDPEVFVHVVEGKLDLFLVGKPAADGESRWHPLLSAGAQTLIPSIPGRGFRVIGRRSPGSKVELIDRV